MKLNFDKFERYELPQVTLCNPNSRAIEADGKITITDTVGVLSNPKGMNLKLNFNAPHELSFDYYRHKSSDPIKQSFYDSIYESIQTDRYIYLTDIGYFIISSVTDSDEDNIDKKSISLKSCEENEFATAEGLSLDEKTYYLHTENNDGLLDLFLPKTAGWTIGFIDPSLLEKPYYVEKTEVDNGYNFLYTTIQDMFECIVEPDIIKRTISVYSRVYYAEHHLTDIHIAKYNLLKHKTVEENDEDKYTALNVQGKDENLEIRAVNPTGKNVIYNFESRYTWMSPALQDAVERWQDKCESVEEEYLTLQQGYYNDMQNIVFPLEEDIKVLELQLKQQQQTRDLIVIGEQDKAIKVVEVLPETGKSNILYFVPTTVNNYEEYVWGNNSWKYIDLIQVNDISDTNQQRALDLVNAAINNTNTVLSEKQSMLEDEKNKVQTNYSERINQINSECALETTDIFTTELRNELMTHIKPTDYVDEYMLVTESMTYPQRFEKAKELMDRAQSQLVKISSGQKTYSVDTRSFLFNKQFKHFSEQLCTGAIIYVEIKNDIMEQLHLTGIDINFDEKSTNFTLGNKYDRSDLKALYEDALGQNSKSFSELKYIAGIIEDQQKQLDYQRNWVADLRTLTLDNVLTSEDQAFEINNRGLIGRKRRLDENGEWDFDENGNPYFEDEQVKIINNTLVFTEDNWKTAATAVGKIAVGYNPDGSVKYSYGINGQVLIGELILGNNLVLTGTGAGIKIKDNNGNDVFFADNDGNLNLIGTISTSKGNIGGWSVSPTAIYKDVELNGKTHRIFMQAPESPVSTNSAFAVRNLTDDTYPFVVSYNGKLKSTDAEVSGKIVAKSGSVGNWLINDGQMQTATPWINADDTGATINLLTVLSANGNVALATGVPENNSKTTRGAANQIFHNGKVRFGRNNGSTESNNDSDYNFVADGSNIKCYGVTQFHNDVTFNKTTEFNNAIILNGATTFNKKADFIKSITVSEDSNFEDSIIVGTSVVCGMYVRPKTSGQGSVGNSNYKWENIYATTGTIQTSDKNAKNNIAKLTDVHKQLFMKLLPVSFTFTDGSSGRTHIGFISQDVEKAMMELGMTSFDFAGFCKDIKTKITLDDLGKEIEVPDLDSNGNKQYLYSLRYDEFIALITYVLQDTVIKLNSFEERLQQVESQQKNL